MPMHTSEMMEDSCVCTGLSGVRSAHRLMHIDEFHSEVRAPVFWKVLDASSGSLWFRARDVVVQPLVQEVW